MDVKGTANVSRFVWQRSNTHPPVSDLDGPTPKSQFLSGGGRILHLLGHIGDDGFRSGLEDQFLLDEGGDGV